LESNNKSSSSTTKGSIFFIENATVLIKYAEFTILTDPIFFRIHEKVPLGYGLDTIRLTNPAMEIKQLPPLDLICFHTFMEIILIKLQYVNSTNHYL
jgi:L-ascorbate metabolism protein UlaG (beta-lactamase superfamily)